MFKSHSLILRSQIYSPTLSSKALLFCLSQFNGLQFTKNWYFCLQFKWVECFFPVKSILFSSALYSHFCHHCLIFSSIFNRFSWLLTLQNEGVCTLTTAFISDYLLSPNICQLKLYFNIIKTKTVYDLFLIIINSSMLCA